MRRVADLQIPNKGMKSVSGRSKDDEVARYIEAADQERLANSAIQRVSQWEAELPAETENAMAKAVLDALAVWDLDDRMSDPTQG